MDDRKLEDTLTDAERLTLEIVEREVRVALAEAPSAEFFVRVRQRTAGASMAMPAWMRLPWAAAGLVLAACALVLGIAALRPQPHAMADRPSATSLDPPQRLAAVAKDGADEESAPPDHASPPGNNRFRTIRAAAATAVSEPEVLVAPGQLDAVRQYVEHFRASPVTEQPLTLTGDDVPSPPRYSDLVLASLKLEPSSGLGDVRPLEVVHKYQ
jgi:hypothetical protein